MELTTLYTREKANAGAEIQIREPGTGKKTDFFIKVVGTASDKWTNMKRSLRVAAFTAKGKEELPMNEAEMLAEAVLDWRGLVNDGKPVPFTKENAVALFTEAPEVFDQVNTFVGESANFTTPRKGNSSNSQTGTSTPTDTKKAQTNRESGPGSE